MRHNRADVVEHAIAVLDEYGLADLTMRRLGTELGVRPSALYHHFPNKQALLAAVADELLARGLRPVSEGAWYDRVSAAAVGLRDALLAWRDGAELVATVHAFGLGGAAAYEHLRLPVAASGLDDALVTTAARTLLHYVLGHATAQQTHVQATGAGAIEGVPVMDADADFAAGLALVVDGIRTRVTERA